MEQHMFYQNQMKDAHVVHRTVETTLSLQQTQRYDIYLMCTHETLTILLFIIGLQQQKNQSSYSTCNTSYRKK